MRLVDIHRVGVIGSNRAAGDGVRYSLAELPLSLWWRNSLRKAAVKA